MIIPSINSVSKTFNNSFNNIIDVYSIFNRNDFVKIVEEENVGNFLSFFLRDYIFSNISFEDLNYYTLHYYADEIERSISVQDIQMAVKKINNLKLIY